MENSNKKKLVEKVKTDEKKFTAKRLFIAIILPNSAKNYLYKITSDLNRRDKDIRAIPAENVHLTLKFLGDTPTDKIHKIAEAVKKTAGSFDKFTYEISDNLGAFPGFNSARILFVPVSDGKVMIQKIFNNLEDNLSKIKIKKEGRNFICHITVARIREKKNIGETVKDLKLEYREKLLCSKLTLFESVLRSSGAEYIILEEFELK